MTRTRSALIVTIAMVAMLAMSITAAFAQYPPSSAFGVSCVVSGDTVTCAVVGADANERLTATVTCDGTVAFDETVTADAAGEATFSFASGGAANCDVSVLGASSGNTGATLTLASGTDDGGQAVGPGTTGSTGTTGTTGSTGDRTLPFTGSELTIFLAVGLALVALGTVAIRRRGADA